MLPIQMNGMSHILSHWLFGCTEKLIVKRQNEPTSNLITF